MDEKLTEIKDRLNKYVYHKERLYRELRNICIELNNYKWTKDKLSYEFQVLNNLEHYLSNEIVPLESIDDISSAIQYIDKINN